MQEEKSEKNGEDGTRFIDRDHLIHISDLQCTEVAQPGSTGGKSGQDQKCPGFGRNTSDAVLCPDQKYRKKPIRLRLCGKVLRVIKRLPVN
jgi:hypothetical protein